MTDARSIHVSTNDPILFLLCLNNIPLYICTTSLLSTNLLMKINNLWEPSVQHRELSSVSRDDPDEKEGGCYLSITAAPARHS